VTLFDKTNIAKFIRTLRDGSLAVASF